MNDQLTHLRKMLANSELNLQLIEERISNYVRSVDVPLELIRNKREVEAQIADLKARIAALSGGQEAPSGSQSTPPTPQQQEQSQASQSATGSGIAQASYGGTATVIYNYYYTNPPSGDQQTGTPRAGHAPAPAQQRKPAAFMSYTTFDDEHSDGALSTLGDKLGAAVRFQTGEPFSIFRPTKDIGWGQNWQTRIDKSLDAVTFFIPIITPGFFNDEQCRIQMERFMAREQQLGRTDLILPIYYVTYAPLEKRAHPDPAIQNLISVISQHQYVDWRDLRFEPYDAPHVRKLLSKMAEQISQTLSE